VQQTRQPPATQLVAPAACGGKVARIASIVVGVLLLLAGAWFVRKKLPIAWFQKRRPVASDDDAEDPYDEAYGDPRALLPPRRPPRSQGGVKKAGGVLPPILRKTRALESSRFIESKPFEKPPPPARAVRFTPPEIEAEDEGDEAYEGEAVEQASDPEDPFFTKL
jgi:hypothetical protein